HYQAKLSLIWELTRWDRSVADTSALTSLAKAGINRPRSAQPLVRTIPPVLFHADGEPLKLKARDFHDSATATRHHKASANVPVRAKRIDQQRTAGDEVSLVWPHHCNLFLRASIRMWVSWSTRGIRRDDVSMSRFSLSHLHS